MLIVDEANNGAPVKRRWGFAVSAGILGWVLDAFDFFVLVFLVDVLAARFGVGKAAIVATITFTLAARPVGALVLGALADRFGRRRPLVICVVYFSVITAMTPFAPNYTMFVVLRTLYGVGMGGYWGIGASLVMESSPARLRGLFSGMMQAGYSCGYLLAAVAMRTLEPRFGWQSMFFAGLAVAVVIAVLTWIAPESESWERSKVHTVRDVFTIAWQHKRRFLYLVLVMTGMTSMSHGTQDLYPDFLKSVHHISSATVSNLAILYNVGAVAGALTVAHFSDRLGRRKCIMLALCVCVLAMPAWAFGQRLTVLALGSFAMQFGVQGAFGVIPAHLNELSPGSVRSLFPGITYQLGTVLSAPCVVAEYALRSRLGYPWALTLFEGCVIATLFLLYGFGPERRGHDLAS